MLPTFWLESIACYRSICRKCLSVTGRGAAQFVEVYAMLVDMETTFVAMALRNSRILPNVINRVLPFEGGHAAKSGPRAGILMPQVLVESQP